MTPEECYELDEPVYLIIKTTPTGQLDCKCLINYSKLSEAIDSFQEVVARIQTSDKGMQYLLACCSNVTAFCRKAKYHELNMRPGHRVEDEGKEYIAGNVWHPHIVDRTYDVQRTLTQDAHLPRSPRRWQLLLPRLLLCLLRTPNQERRKVDRGFYQRVSCETRNA